MSADLDLTTPTFDPDDPAYVAGWDAAMSYVVRKFEGQEVPLGGNDLREHAKTILVEALESYADVMRQRGLMTYALLEKIENLDFRIRTLLRVRARHPKTGYGRAPEPEIRPEFIRADRRDALVAPMPPKEKQ